MVKRTRKGWINMNATVASEIDYCLKAYGSFTAWDLREVINNQIKDPNERLSISQVRSRLSKAHDFGYSLVRNGSCYRAA